MAVYNKYFMVYSRSNGWNIRLPTIYVMLLHDQDHGAQCFYPRFSTESLREFNLIGMNCCKLVFLQHEHGLYVKVRIPGRFSYSIPAIFPWLATLWCNNPHHKSIKWTWLCYDFSKFRICSIWFLVLCTLLTRRFFWLFRMVWWCNGEKWSAWWELT